MNDRALILECDMDLHEMKREHTNLCELKFTTEWKDAKAEYNKGEKWGLEQTRISSVANSFVC